MDNEKIKQYLSVINSDYNNIDTGLVELAIDEVAMRVKLYLNSDTIPEGLEMILANIINTVLKRYVKGLELGNDTDTAISSVSDNGQSVSYANTLTNYFVTASDNELFSGFTALLSRYRKIKVVNKQ